MAKIKQQKIAADPAIGGVAVDSEIRSRPQPRTPGLEALRDGIREAKRWYAFNGQKMVVSDDDGRVVHVPPSEVLPDERDEKE